MHRVTNHARIPRTNEFTIGGALMMLAGSVVYLIDEAPSGPSWHLFRAPAIFLLVLGVALAFVGRIFERE